MVGEPARRQQVTYASARGVSQRRSPDRDPVLHNDLYLPLEVFLGPDCIIGYPAEIAFAPAGRGHSQFLPQFLNNVWLVRSSRGSKRGQFRSKFGRGACERNIGGQQGIHTKRFVGELFRFPYHFIDLTRGQKSAAQYTQSPCVGYGCDKLRPGDRASHAAHPGQDYGIFDVQHVT